MRRARVDQGGIRNDAHEEFRPKRCRALGDRRSARPWFRRRKALSHRPRGRAAGSSWCGSLCRIRYRVRRTRRLHSTSPRENGCQRRIYRRDSPEPFPTSVKLRTRRPAPATTRRARGRGRWRANLVRRQRPGGRVASLHRPPGRPLLPLRQERLRSASVARIRSLSSPSAQAAPTRGIGTGV
jgi:hypothetical protein